jgi:hypothetical protein
VKANSELQILAFLLLTGFGAGGWFYGLHWKRVASGDLFTNDERLLVRLQDQIEALTKENEALHLRLRRLEGGGGDVAPAAVEPAPAVTADPVALPASSPAPPPPPATAPR